MSRHSQSINTTPDTDLSSSAAEGLHIPSLETVGSAVQDSASKVGRSLKTAGTNTYTVVRENPYWTAAAVAGALGLGYLAYRMVSGPDMKLASRKRARA